MPVMLSEAHGMTESFAALEIILGAGQRLVDLKIRTSVIGRTRVASVHSPLCIKFVADLNVVDSIFGATGSNDEEYRGAQGHYVLPSRMIW